MYGRVLVAYVWYEIKLGKSLAGFLCRGLNKTIKNLYRTLSSTWPRPISCRKPTGAAVVTSGSLSLIERLAMDLG